MAFLRVAFFLMTFLRVASLVAFLRVAFFLWLRSGLLLGSLLRVAFFLVAFLRWPSSWLPSSWPSFLATFLRVAFFLVAFFLVAFFLVAFFLVAFLRVAFFLVAFLRVTFFLATFLEVTFFLAASFGRSASSGHVEPFRRAAETSCTCPARRCRCDELYHIGMLWKVA